MAWPHHIYIFILISCCTMVTALVPVDIGCFVEQDCLGGVSAGVNVASSPEDCLDQCKTVSTCKFFTYYTDGDGICIIYKTCDTPQPCTNCISGDVTCDPNLQCDLDGLCEGITVGFSQESTRDGCVQSCKDTTDCAWWSIDFSVGICSLLSGCDNLNQDCLNCLSGERGCSLGGDQSTTTTTTTTTPAGGSTTTTSYAPPDDHGFNKLFVVGGIDSYDGSNILDTAELIDLSGEAKVCPVPAAYVHRVRGGAAVANGNKPVVCGGADDSITFNDCWSYDVSGQQWTLLSLMSKERSSFGLVPENSDNFYILGGFDGTLSAAGYLDSTEIFSKSSGSFASGVDMPIPVSGHCTVKIDDNTIAVMGGSNGEVDIIGGQYRYDYFGVYDRVTKSWIQLAPMLEERSGHQCGLVTKSDGKQQIVVAGGITTEFSSEIYEFGSGIGRWRQGPEVTAGAANGASVQFLDTFLIVGGQDMAQMPMRSLIEFVAEPVESWVYLNVSLVDDRNAPAAVMLHEDWVNC